jgi:hypothetical protein
VRLECFQIRGDILINELRRRNNHNNRMKQKTTFATILEKNNVFSKKEIEDLVLEALGKDISLTNLIVSKGLKTRLTLSSLLKINKFDILLGELLVETNTVKPSVVQQALHEQKTSKEYIGAIIEKLAHISHEGLVEVLRAHLEKVE